jgi:archaellum component FlaC
MAREEMMDREDRLHFLHVYEEIERINMAITALQVEVTKLAADVATFTAQAAGSVPQAEVDAITVQIKALDDAIVAAITPPAAVPAAPAAPAAPVAPAPVA